MTTMRFSLSRNARLVCLADFFWNAGRTLPHAVLTIFLLSQGCDLAKIAVLQSIFMVVAFVAEFPSGVFADRTSRKAIYIASVFVLLAAYFLIGAFDRSFAVLAAAYALYGFSDALKSGTLDADATLECRGDEAKIRDFSVASSLAQSASSMLGAFLGSVFYAKIRGKIYFASLFLFAISIVFASLCRFEKFECKSRSTLKKELCEGAKILRSSRILQKILILSAVSMLFLQPFYQYWQVLFADAGVDERLFGAIYCVFHFCNIAGSLVYNKFCSFRFFALISVAACPAFFCLAFLGGKFACVASIVLAVTAFYAYSQSLDVATKTFAPQGKISSFISLRGVVCNTASVASLFLMAALSQKFSIAAAYFALFAAFAVLTFPIAMS